MAKNRVINGEYAGSVIVGGKGVNAAISLGMFKKLNLNNTNVERYEVLGETVTDIKPKNDYQVMIIFKDGKKSLLEIDGNLYKAIVQACF